MFSEYASRFLAQSQSRIGFGQPGESTRGPLGGQRRQQQRIPHSSRSYLQRPTLGNPYQTGGSHLSQFPFASRSHANAPLFYSATDDLREEDDTEEHEREVADYYAMQRSRRHFGESRLEESSEVEDERSTGSIDANSDGRGIDNRGRSREGGLRSSWRGEGEHSSGRPKASISRADRRTSLTRIRSDQSSEKKEHMVDVGLESTTHGSVIGDEPPDDLAIEIAPDDDPPSIQQFRKPPVEFGGKSPLLPQETECEDSHGRPSRPDSEDESSALPEVSHHGEPPRHDVFWGHLYLICLASLFASFCLVYLHTYTPKRSLGDTVYTTLHSSYHLLAVDTLVAVIVSLIWLAVLWSYARPLVYSILVGVPIILFSFFLYPLISSFKGQARTNNVQDKAMRYLSFIPAIMSLLWTFTVYKGRYSFGKAISILEFSCRILAANPGLLMLGFASLLGVVIWTWIWMAMFTRVFLGGHLSNAKNFFIIDAGTWWLGIFFVLVYLWTLAVGAGIQRATTAATVSQWYFHRLTIPAPTSRQVVTAAFNHATIALFGTICLSTLLSLLIRLPFLVLPRRVTALVGLCSYTLIPSTISTYTSPLTLTYSAIHSQPLSVSSRAISRLSVLPPVSTADTPFTPGHHPGSAKNDLLPYTLSLLLLRSTRFITSLALGFVAWVSTAKQLTISTSASSSSSAPNATVKGSLYAYVVGLIAAAIGWGVMGAIDGVLTGVVDALVVCWGSERARGEVRYCREAEGLFGADREERRRRRMGGGEEDEEEGLVGMRR
ncbi:MAG: hypothetical protein L6R35_001516 [Caloplaca aegaea]|nr:MAG: hypothetical protein L6R35_001516 [Caloplaca aegaea]